MIFSRIPKYYDWIKSHCFYFYLLLLPFPFMDTFGFFFFYLKAFFRFLIFHIYQFNIFFRLHAQNNSIQSIQIYQPMLTLDKVQTLGLSNKGKVVELHKPSFISSHMIWLKTKQYPLSISVKSKTKRHAFFKYGKTLGLQTTRFLSYSNGFFYYYEQEDETEPKGYCQLQNLYMYFLEGTKNNFILYLTNGVDSTILYFANDSFLKNIGQEFFKEIIQVNYKQKYKIMEQIGEGTFSKVYLAENRVTKQKYALKIIPKSNQSEISIKQIVREEKLILKKLNSHLTCKMYEFFQDQHDFIFVLEYIQGKDLSKELKNRGQIPINEVIHILKQILKALELIHHHHIIHRDLKPQNVVYSPQQKSIKLIDFGLSLCYNQNTPLAKFIRCGTMGYLAPQVANNYEHSRKKYDCKSDMFGFGIICHILLLGKNPIKGKTYKATCENNIKCLFILDQIKIVEKYGDPCYNFLKSLLQINPQQRLSSSEALKHQFLNSHFDDDEAILNEHLTSLQSTKMNNNQQINCIEDKQYMLNPQKYKNLSDSVQISSPMKNSQNVKTATSFNSGHRFSGLS